MKKEKPLVSIVVPTFNRDVAVRHAIKSALSQTYNNTEVIVIDDCSLDKTEKVVKRINSEKIKYYRNDTNKGASASRNKGIELSSGTYIAFLDSDDLWYKGKVSYQVKKIKSSKCGLCYTGEEIYSGKSGKYEGKILSKKRAKQEGKVFNKLLYKDFIGSCSKVMAKKSILKSEKGFDERLSAREDWDMWLRLAKSNEVCCVDRCLVKRHIGGGGLSRNQKRMTKCTKMILNKHSKYITKRDDLMSHHFSMLSKRLMAHEKTEGWAMAIASLLINPYQLKLISAFLISFFGENVYSYLLKLWSEYRGHYARSRG